MSEEIHFDVETGGFDSKPNNEVDMYIDGEDDSDHLRNLNVALSYNGKPLKDLGVIVCCDMNDLKTTAIQRDIVWAFMCGIKLPFKTSLKDFKRLPRKKKKVIRKALKARRNG